MRMIRNDPTTAVPKGQLVEEGRRLFMKETFNGNGRTCLTCHRPTNNFTIDAPFIRTLPKRDALFVAETNRNLRELENSTLLRRFGLITENLDGFNQPGVLRGVPHTLALPTSRTPEPGSPTSALSEVLGWSGDGSPGTGSLREFAIGAVVQHFPKTLNRVPDVDFRLPTEQELEALLAFQLSLGRQGEFALDSLVFTDPVVTRGQQLFEDAPARDGSRRSCEGCHNEAGANDATGANRNRTNGTELLPTAPSCRGNAPGDGGFGFAPITVQELCGKIATFIGDRSFNTPPLVEAADTPPFFHNNSAATIEDAVAFYTSDTFNNSPTGGGRAFVLSADDIKAVGAMLRAINALENIRQTIALADDAKRFGGPRRREGILQGIAETEDAIDDISDGPIVLFAATTAKDRLTDALSLQKLALRKPARAEAFLTQAQDALAQARAQMVQ